MLTPRSSSSEADMAQIIIALDTEADIEDIATEIGWDPEGNNALPLVIEWMAGICKAWLDGTLTKRRKV